MSNPSMMMLAAAGSAAWTPLSLSPALWLDASDIATITSSSGAVSQWDDKSGNGRHVTQATASRKPTTGTTTVNGLNVLSFDGGDWLQAATAATWAFLHNTPTTAFVVYRFAAGGFSTLYGTARGAGGTIGHTHFLNGGEQVQHYNNNGLALVVKHVSNAHTGRGTAVNQTTILSDPGNATAASRSVIRANGSVAGGSNAQTGTASSSNPYGALTIGADPAGSYLLTGTIAELIIVPSLVTGTNLTDVESYLNTKWAVY